MKVNIERVVIAILAILLIWFGTAIIRLENYHYAVQVGMCENNGETKDAKWYIEYEKCLNNTQTRTSNIGHLLYGLKIF